MTTVALKLSLYALMAAHVVASAVAWPLLPEQMPLHFGFDGRLTASAPASPVLWFLPPVLAWGVVALVIAASGPPESWKLSKASLASFRELNADDQRRVRDAKDRALYITMMLFVVCMMGLQAGIFIAADRELDHLPFASDVVMFGSLAALVAVSVRGGRRVESLIRSAAQSSGEASTMAEPQRRHPVRRPG